MPKRRPQLPMRVQRALQKLGADIRDARVRRRISTSVMAERALISRNTLRKIERGDPGTAIGFYASALFVLDLSHRLGEIVDVTTDDLGLALSGRDLPKRVRRTKQPSGSGRDSGL